MIRHSIPLLLIALVAGCDRGVDSEMLDGLESGTYAAFDTTSGDFVMRLFTEETPNTASNFIQLAEGTRPHKHWKSGKWINAPFYDGQLIHRVEGEFIVQGGDPLGTGLGGPGYEIPDEIVPGLRFDKPLMVGMASSGPDTGGSQWFVALRAAPELNDRYTIFGQVVRGAETLKAISTVPTRRERPIRNIRVREVDIIRIGSDGERMEPAGTPQPVRTMPPKSVEDLPPAASENDAGAPE